jgi:myo-inositol-1(or 4)-monophosphatase
MLSGPESLVPSDPEAVFGPPAAAEDPLLADLASAAVAAAVAATAITAGGFRQPRETIDTKSSATDMVSEIDRGSEAAIASVLAERRPDDGILGEEGADRFGSTGVRWVVDPLDGTTNYLFGVPSWSVSIAAECDGQVVVGIVVDPSQHEVWGAVAGRGARLNGTVVHCAEGRSTVATALVATGFGYDARRRAWQAGVLTTVLPRIRDLRRFGSAAVDLCWVAAGRVDGFYEWGLNPWDRAAGSLICEEAGGCVDLVGRLLVATTPSLREPLGALLAEAGATTAPEVGD